LAKVTIVFFENDLEKPKSFKTIKYAYTGIVGEGLNKEENAIL